MNKNIFQRKEFLASTIFMGVNLAILILGTWFITLKIIDSGIELKEKKAALEATYQGWQQMSHEQKEIQQIKPELEKMNKAFLSEADPIGFINLLETLAQKTNNIFEINLTPENEANKKDEKAKALSFQISLAGSFPDFMHFLKYLENMGYYTEIQSIQISQATEQSMMAKPEWRDMPAGNVVSLINLKVFTSMP